MLSSDQEVLTWYLSIYLSPVVWGMMRRVVSFLGHDGKGDLVCWSLRERRSTLILQGYLHGNMIFILWFVYSFTLLGFIYHFLCFYLLLLLLLLFKSRWSFIRIWVTVSLLKSSRLYSGRTQQCCGLDCLDSCTDIFYSFFLSFGAVPSAPITTVITVNLIFYTMFCSLARSKNLSIFSALLHFPSVNGKIHLTASSLFCLFVRYGLLARIWWSVYILKKNNKKTENFIRLILVCAYTISLFGQISISCAIPSGQPFLPSLAQSAVFAYYAINRFVSLSLSAQTILTILFRFINFRFNVIVHYGIFW